MNRYVRLVFTFSLSPSVLVHNLLRPVLPMPMISMRCRLMVNTRDRHESAFYWFKSEMFQGNALDLTWVFLFDFAFCASAFDIPPSNGFSMLCLCACVSVRVFIYGFSCLFLYADIGSMKRYPIYSGSAQKEEKSSRHRRRRRFFCPFPFVLLVTTQSFKPNRTQIKYNQLKAVLLRTSLLGIFTRLQCIHKIFSFFSHFSLFLSLFFVAAWTRENANEKNEAEIRITRKQLTLS